jgi:hypothetical protein
MIEIRAFTEAFVRRRLDFQIKTVEETSSATTLSDRVKLIIQRWATRFIRREYSEEQGCQRLQQRYSK